MFRAKDAQSPHESLYFYENFNLVAVRAGKWKLVLSAGAKAKKGPKTPELYDLENDLSETNNMADANEAIHIRLQILAEKARDDLGDDATKRKGKNRRPAGDAK